MPKLIEQIERKFFPRAQHPFELYLGVIRSFLRPGCTILDAGCGRTAEIIHKLSQHSVKTIGVDVVPFEPSEGRAHLVNCDLEQLGLRGGCADLVISRSVLEHLEDPSKVFEEVSRVLAPDGHFIFLTPNRWDYASLLSRLIPNRWHPTIVRRCGGRPERDTFPAYYRSNTVSSIRQLASMSGLDIVEVSHLGQYPYYLSFNAVTFLIGTLYEKLIGKFTCFAFLRGWLLAVLVKSPNGELSRCAE